MKAYCLIRELPHYRRDAFVGGLTRAGFKVVPAYPQAVQPGEVLVVWNRYGTYHDMANKFERAGGLVLVAENGYLGVDAQGIQMYALSIHGHNGSGWWPEGVEKRFPKLGIEPKPWRERGSHIYIRGQRGIGSPEMASPSAWHEQMHAKLVRKTDRTVVVAAHPGKPAIDPEQVLKTQAALAGAQACVIWSSAVGVRALIEGVPVFYSAPHWICAGSAKADLDIEHPLMDDAARAQALERMAWAQWSVAELITGEPFVRLLECDRSQRGADRAEEVVNA